MAVPPDLTLGEAPVGDPTSSAPKTTNLGPTGLRGWLYHVRTDSSESRQILITEVDADSPADGILAVDDVILGASGDGTSPGIFSSDARRSLADAIADAEANDPATLQLLRWRDGEPSAPTTVSITLQHLGAYAATAPYNCAKSSQILASGVDHFLGNESSGRYNFGAMALLAADDPAHPDHAARRARLQAEAHSLIPSPAVAAQMMSDAQDTAGMITWQRGHTLIFLAEYHLVTGDALVLPAIEAYAVNIAKNSSLFGTVGHKYADKNLDGSNNGPMGGVYGVVNSAGMPCFLGILLARECGLANPEINPAIESMSRFFSYYSGRGAVPYGEHEAFWQGHENNGKSGLAALSFMLEPGRVEEGGFFAKMGTASFNERDKGHTGSYFNYLWGPLGAACGGEEAAAAHFSRIRWMLDLHRRWDGGFDYDTLNREGPNSGSQYNDFRMSTAALLTYALPMRRLHLTGRGHDNSRWLDTADVAEAITAGDYDAASRTTGELVADLGMWSPKVQREAADELGTHSIDTATLAQLTALATTAPGSSRIGACLALGKIVDSGTADARAATLAGLLTDPENHVRYMAAEAMRYLPQSAKMSQLNTVLAAAASTATPLIPYDEEDPLHFAHGKIAILLFYSGSAYGPKGMIYNNLTGVDRGLLYPAIEAVAAHPIGFCRSTLSTTYRDSMTKADIEAVAGAVVDSVMFRAPADKMFSGGVRQGGLDALEKHGFAEGVPVSMIYMVNDERGGTYTSALGVLEDYAGGSTTVDPDPDVIGFCEALLGGSHAAAAQAVLDAIASDPSPAVLTPFKSIQSVSAGSPSLTLPNTSTTLQVASTDLADGDSVFTWRKVHGIGNVTFTPNGTSGSDTTTISFDGMPGQYLFEVTVSDSRGLTEVRDRVPVTLYEVGGTLPPNDPPTANPQTITTSPAGTTPITLTGSDPEDYALGFTILSGPSSGSLTGTPPDLVYHASWNYAGNDSFTFEVMDTEGQVSSAIVSITIEPGMYWDGGDSDIVTSGGGSSDGGDGTWNTSLLNWDEGPSSHVSWNNANNDVAFFGGSPGTVTVTDPITVGGLQFDTPGYLIQGEALTFTTTGEIAVRTFPNQSVTIASDIAGSAGLTKTGEGDLRPTHGDYSFTGDINITQGNLIFHSGANDGVARTLGGGDFSGDVHIAGGSTFQFYRDSNSSSQTFSGVISGAGDLRLAYNTTYHLTGANTYTGKTIFHGEFNGKTVTLNVSSFNSVLDGQPSSSLGAPTTVENGTVDIGRTGMQASAILNYTGPGETTDRVMNLVASGTSTKVVNNRGTGPLVFTSPWIAPVATGLRMPITTDSDMSLTGSLPGTPRYLEKRGVGKLHLEGACNIWDYVHLYEGTLEIDSAINDGGVYTGPIATGPGNGGASAITVPAGTPIEVGMTVVHGRCALGTTIIAITDINADPIVALISPSASGGDTMESGSIGFAGALGIGSSDPSKLRWVNSATLKYDGPTNSTNRAFTIDNTDTATWQIIGGSNLTVSGGTAATSGKLTKTGAGILTLSGSQAYTGVTTVSAGTLALVGGSQTSPITVATGASLGFTLGSPTTSTSSVDLTNGTVKITGAVDNASDYQLMTASSFTGTPTLDAAITDHALELQNSDTELWLVYTGVGGNPFGTWAGTGTLGPVTFDGDTNGDGVQDGLAFLLGVTNPDHDAKGKLPEVSEDGGELVLTFNCLPVAARGGASLKVAHSNTLASWTPTTAVVPDTTNAVPDNHVTFVVDTVSAAPLNKVTATIDPAAAAGGKLFGRLIATE